MLLCKFAVTHTRAMLHLDQGQVAPEQRNRLVCVESNAVARSASQGLRNRQFSQLSIWRAGTAYTACAHLGYFSRCL